uniref:Uncharacterized protein n=1 Tax=Rhizophora mucronata TaxID=61149 RepID=A0A2P2M3F7_RHIMU
MRHTKKMHKASQIGPFYNHKVMEKCIK